MKIFITRVLPEAGLKKIRDAGIEIIEWSERRELSQEELIEYCKQCDALLNAGHNKIDEHFLTACSHLKVVSLNSVGYDNVDVAAATRLKIPIGNTPDVLSVATANTAFLLMLAVSRKALYHHKRILKGEWGFYEPTKGLGIELEGKTLGIFGLGKIGFVLAKKCIRAFDMKIIYHNRHNNREAEDEVNAVKVSFDELLNQSDILSVHTSLNPQTAGKFNIDTFKKMKSSSIFINTARGGIHNESDLIEALDKGIIWGAGLDVTNPEPMNQHNPLLNMPNVAVFPHIGSATVETRDAMATIAAENAMAGLFGKRLPHIVNPDVYK